MHIFYDNEKSTPVKFNIHAMNPNSQWANHSYNLFVLQHIAKSSTDFNERWQARKEMDIAERKMKFWERHENFDNQTAMGWRKKIYSF